MQCAKGSADKEMMKQLEQARLNRAQRKADRAQRGSTGMMQSVQQATSGALNRVGLQGRIPPSTQAQSAPRNASALYATEMMAPPPPADSAGSVAPANVTARISGTVGGLGQRLASISPSRTRPPP
eukprot:SAG31_NODE_21973_length_536_cov_1.462243_1_plen_125_part_10